MEDWQQRTQLLLGDEKMERLRRAHVLVVGLGGVGAYAAEMICRAGVGRMTIVDADTVLAYEYKPSVAGSAFYPGAKEGGDIGITFQGH